MALWQGRSRRKKTGGRYNVLRSKRKSEIGREQQIAVIGKDSKKRVRTRGGNIKYRVLSSKHANIYDSKKKKTERAEIKSVLENPANPNYVRRNIISKGAIIETDLGKARITSRPGQDGVINGVIVK